MPPPQMRCFVPRKQDAMVVVDGGSDIIGEGMYQLYLSIVYVGNTQVGYW